MGEFSDLKMLMSSKENYFSAQDSSSHNQNTTKNLRKIKGKPLEKAFL